MRDGSFWRADSGALARATCAGSSHPRPLRSAPFSAVGELVHRLVGGLRLCGPGPAQAHRLAADHLRRPRPVDLPPDPRGAPLPALGARSPPRPQAGE
eukprot:4151663-Prymnesium_polylepis.1